MEINLLFSLWSYEGLIFQNNFIFPLFSEAEYAIFDPVFLMARFLSSILKFKKKIPQVPISIKRIIEGKNMLKQITF